MLDFRTDHFAPKPSVGGTAHRWNSTQNTYGLASDAIFERSPLKVRVRDVHIIWNLFDGYDWQKTRDTISQAVKDIETRAMARRPRSSSRNPVADEEEESVKIKSRGRRAGAIETVEAAKHPAECQWPCLTEGRSAV